MDCRFVILVKLVKKAMPVVQNAPVVMLVNQVLVMGAHAKNARRVNLVRPTITTLLLVHPATQDIIKKIDGLAEAVEQLVPGANTASRASAVEFILDGLHINQMLNKNRVGGRITYSSYLLFQVK